ncbi:MAG TPA: maleylpyruvate isomerase family mycothiol-dependent enzyme [Marmoricola sp.]
MPEILEFEEYGDGIGAAWMVLREHSNRAPRDAPVPTCPDWTMADLVAHQGTVHRWAAANLRGTPMDEVDTEAMEAEGLAAVDQGEWFDEGAKALLQALVDAPDDLAATFFLVDAPPAKFAWARRQCHETSIHAVDAMSVSLGRAPLAAETWLSPRVAADGIDELLTGFVPRPHQKVRAEQPCTVVVEATDVGRAWTMTIGPDPVVTTRERVADPDTVLSGTATQLYLGLWNRGDEFAVTGADFLRLWRDRMTVRWA